MKNVTAIFAPLICNSSLMLLLNCFPTCSFSSTTLLTFFFLFKQFFLALVNFFKSLFSSRCFTILIIFSISSVHTVLLFSPDSTLNFYSFCFFITFPTGSFSSTTLPSFFSLLYYSYHLLIHFIFTGQCSSSHLLLLFISQSSCSLFFIDYFPTSFFLTLLTKSDLRVGLAGGRVEKAAFRT